MTLLTSALLAEHELRYDDLASSPFGSLLADEVDDIDDLADDVRPLSERSARSLWGSLFGTAPSLMEIPDDHLVLQLRWQTVSRWMQDYNERSPERVGRSLARAVSWRPSDSVFFVKGPREIVESAWRAFTTHWMVFVDYCDDGPYILRPDGHEYLQITSLGTFQRGVDQATSTGRGDAARVG